MRHHRLLVFAILLLAPAGVRADASDVYVDDVKFALAQIEEQCGHFFELKGIDWRKVSRRFLKEAKTVETEQDHLVLLVRLLARLKDGHADVLPTERTQDVRMPPDPRGELVGPGMFWCRVGKRIYVKNVSAANADLGIEPGWEVTHVDGEPVGKWLDARIEAISDRTSFSTAHQAFFFACHWGLADAVGTRWKLTMKDERRHKKSRTVVFDDAGYVPEGPAYVPEGLESVGDVRHARTEGGWGYIQVRRCPRALPEQMDQALAAVGDAPGLVLDFRGNSGGAFDHEALMGRFVPEGRHIAYAKRYESAGPQPYGGPVVVIVDGTVRSAGETAAGMFKEDGRAYMIGESPTAGMSSSKTVIDLPSGLFRLRVSVHSNMGRFNGGRGIEGIGVEPHEIVPFDPEDLAARRDTLILRAEAVLERFPQNKVPYNPRHFR
ncbi:MAG: S41 family peptidase [Planctomycetota bacterium]